MIKQLLLRNSLLVIVFILTSFSLYSQVNITCIDEGKPCLYKYRVFFSCKGGKELSCSKKEYSKSEVYSIESIKLIYDRDTLMFYNSNAIKDSNIDIKMKEMLLPNYEEFLSVPDWYIYIDRFPFEKKNIRIAERYSKENKISMEEISTYGLYIKNQQIIPFVNK